MAFTVSLSGEAASDVTDRLEDRRRYRRGGAADYAAVTAGGVDHHRRGRPAPPISVTTTEDVLVEGDETFTVTLSRAVRAPTLPAGVSLSGTASFGHRHHHRRRHRPNQGVAHRVAVVGGGECRRRTTEVTVTGTLEGGVALNTATTVTVSVGGGTATCRERTSRDGGETSPSPSRPARPPAPRPSISTPPTTTLAEGSETVAVSGTVPQGTRADGRTARP